MGLVASSLAVETAWNEIPCNRELAVMKEENGVLRFVAPYRKGEMTEDLKWCSPDSFSFDVNDCRFVSLVPVQSRELIDILQNTRQGSHVKPEMPQSIFYESLSSSFGINGTYSGDDEVSDWNYENSEGDLEVKITKKVRELFGIPFIDFEKANLDSIDLTEGGFVVSEPNVLHPLAIGKSKSLYWCIFPFCKYSIAEIMALASGAFSSEHRKSFTVFQLLKGLESLHYRNVFLGGMALENIYMNARGWVFLNGCVDAKRMLSALGRCNVLSGGGKSKPSVAIGKFNAPVLDIDFKCVLDKWIHWELSNYDYLMFLNRMSGRELSNDLFHPIFPWVTDFKTPAGSYRNLKKSKFRLSKGEQHLDNMFVSAIPHHIYNVLSEVAYCTYKARILPKAILAKYVRSKFVSKEYPNSMFKLYQWTSDECIPEFYSDPSILKSIHPDLEDLILPLWTKTPEEFISYHRGVLESETVSKNLHHWIDLVFGFKLTGTPAVISKNVPLSLVDQRCFPSTGELVQLFLEPHPHRAARRKAEKHTKTEFEDVSQLCNDLVKLSESDRIQGSYLNNGAFISSKDQLINIPQSFSNLSVTRKMEQIEFAPVFDSNPKMVLEFFTVLIGNKDFWQTKLFRKRFDYFCLAVVVGQISLDRNPYVHCWGSFYRGIRSCILQMEGVEDDSMDIVRLRNLAILRNAILNNLASVPLSFREFVEKCLHLQFLNIKIYWNYGNGLVSIGETLPLATVEHRMRFPEHLDLFYYSIVDIENLLCRMSSPSARLLNGSKMFFHALVAATKMRMGDPILLKDYFELFFSNFISASVVYDYFDFCCELLGRKNSLGLLWKPTVNIFEKVVDSACLEIEMWDTIAELTKVVYGPQFFSKLVENFGLKELLRTFLPHLVSAFAMTTIGDLSGINEGTLAVKGKDIEDVALQLETPLMGLCPKLGDIMCFVGIFNPLLRNFISSRIKVPFKDWEKLCYVLYSCLESYDCKLFRDRIHHFIERILDSLAIYSVIEKAPFFDDVLGELLTHCSKLPEEGANPRLQESIKPLLILTSLYFETLDSSQFVEEMFDTCDKVCLRVLGFLLFDTGSNILGSMNAWHERREVCERLLRIIVRCLFLADSESSKTRITPFANLFFIGVYFASVDADVDLGNVADTLKEYYKFVFSPKICSMLYSKLCQANGQETMRRMLVSSSIVETTMYEYMQTNPHAEVEFSRVDKAARSNVRKELVSPVSSPSQKGKMKHRSLKSQSKRVIGKVLQSLDFKSGNQKVTDWGELNVSLTESREKYVTAFVDGRANPFSCEAIGLFEAHKGPIHSIREDDFETRLLSCGKDKSVKLWDIGKTCSNEGITPLYTHTHDSVPYQADFIGDRNLATVDGKLNIFNFEISSDQSSSFSPKDGSTLYGFNLCNSGRDIVCQGAGQSLHIFDWRTNSFVRQWRGGVEGNGASIRSICVSKSEAWIGIGYSSGEMSIMDVRTGVVVSSWLAHCSEITLLKCLTNDLLASASTDGKTKIWDVSNVSCVRVIEHPGKEMLALEPFRNSLIALYYGNSLAIHQKWRRLDHPFEEKSLESASSVIGNLSCMGTLDVHQQIVLGSDDGAIGFFV
eukprot:Nk52_evm34s164 gene=Nk52_evmTU34s164